VRLPGAIEEVSAGRSIVVDGGQLPVAPLDRCTILMATPVGRDVATRAAAVA
jgi:hypothetical protein